MAQRPNRYTRFAYNAIPAALVEPTAGVQQAGFVAGDRPPAQWINFLFNLSGGWVDYLRGPSMVDWIRRATGVTLVTNPRIGIDVTTPEGATSPVRYAVAGNGGGGPTILSSTRGVTWTTVTANLPVSLISSAVKGITVMGGARWLFWTALQVFSTLRDTSGASALNSGGPAWTLATMPGGLTAIGDLAADPATSTIMLAYDATGAMRFAYSLDNGISFTTSGFTAGPPTGATGGLAWDGTYFVAVSANGEIWRTTGYLASWTLASTQATSALWKLSAGAPGTLALYEANRASGTRILVSTDHGATWTAKTVPADVTNLTKLIWADNSWVASATDAPYVWQTNDLTTWNRSVIPHPDPADALYDIAYGEGAFTVPSLTVVYQSDHAYDAGPGPADGITSPAALSDAAYLRGRVIDPVTVPATGNVLTWDGTKWTPVASTGAGALTPTVDDAATAAVTDLLTAVHTTSGTAAAGIGTGLLMRAENAAGTTTDAARVAGVLTTATGGAEVGALDVYTRTGGAALSVKCRFGGDGGVTIGTTTALGAVGLGLPNATAIYMRNAANSAWISIASMSGAGNIMLLGTAATSRTTYDTSLGSMNHFGSLVVQCSAPLHRWSDYAVTKYFASLQDGIFVMGANDATSSAAAFTIRGAGMAGSNLAGPDLTIQAGLGTGTATPASLVIQGPEKVGSGATAQTVVNLAQFQDSDTDNDTAFLVRIRKSGAESVTRVLIGAVDSGGVGFRLLRIVN